MTFSWTDPTVVNPDCKPGAACAGVPTPEPLCDGSCGDADPHGLHTEPLGL